LYSIATATEIGYFSYIYYVVDLGMYQKIPATVRCLRGGLHSGCCLRANLVSVAGSVCSSWMSSVLPVFLWLCCCLAFASAAEEPLRSPCFFLLPDNESYQGTKWWHHNWDPSF
jgi:thiamine transporter 2/3